MEECLGLKAMLTMFLDYFVVAGVTVGYGCHVPRVWKYFEYVCTLEIDEVDNVSISSVS